VRSRPRRSIARQTAGDKRAVWSSLREIGCGSAETMDAAKR
jgi:hypothetical protein